ncbi:FAD-dependent oxidoreductase [Kordiimonas sediminis]|uniref:Pyridine nucleotide-disulfide oxidoreductase domain-containing protein 2 n=1 Tax=Kordiimonas sediminis TaxID=1735581 RepID=A0A919ATN2_9PROT|nr:NAD(P)/FAD-dependent oxidoreductase [Kordiimonas sediminis]GHF26516.1 FAD-dependent oxidoreductase [Kordiimonas sediminis]
MTKAYDIIIAGGGHNGLVCAAYLAKAGKKVLVLEKNDIVGGAAITKEVFPGKSVSLCAQFLHQFNTRIADDLKLSEFGLEFIDTDCRTSLLSNDGRHLTVSFDGQVEGDVAEDEVKAFQILITRLQEFSETLGFLADIPPIDIFDPDMQDKLSALKLGWKLRFGLGAEKMSDFLRIVGMNIYDLINEELEDDRLKALLSVDSVLGTHAGPRSPGTILTYLYRQIGGGKGRTLVPKGGMGAVSKAIAASAQAKGADILTGMHVREVLIDNCRVVGLRTSCGTVYNAPIVVSNADPKTTVFDMVGSRHFEADFVHRINTIRMRGNSCKLHLSLNSIPEFSGLGSEALAGRVVIADSADYVENSFNPAKYNEWSSSPVIEFSIPTLNDPHLAENGHVLSATIQYAPYSLKGGWTDEAKEAFKNICIDTLSRFAPSLKDSIEQSLLLTPVDLENEIGMQGGNWHHGEFTLDQMLMMRPVPLASRYALPLDGLFLCGAGAHPGGGVMGSAGRNAANAILRGDKS